LMLPGSALQEGTAFVSHRSQCWSSSLISGIEKRSLLEIITMVWRNLRLHTRILIGYSLILALIVTQGLLLMFRVMDLNSQIRRLSAEVTAEATADLEKQSQQAQQLTGAALLLTLLIVTVFGVWLPRTISRPLMDLVRATRQINEGDYAVAVLTEDRSEIGQLAESFNQMTVTLSQQREEVRHQQAVLAAQNQELAQALAELQASTEIREKLAGTIRKLSVPVVPILQRVILIPLVGEIDAERAELLLERLLDGITDEGARIAILDITGVPIVDVQLVEWLVKATMSARLLGAQCILVGIGPEVAQALVASGANLESLMTRANLRQAVEHSIKTVMR
jgi:rsbT co-antagonist protein RsbR